MERIDKLIKLKNEIAITKGFPSWEEMENFIIDANSSQPVNIAVLLVGAMDELADTLINGQNVDVQKMAEEYAARLRPYATNDFHEFTYSYNQIIEAVLYGSTLSQSWVSVEDRLPDTDANVLVSWNGKTVTGFYIKEDPEWYAVTMAGRLRLKNITHWQPLPSPPKEKI